MLRELQLQRPVPAFPAYPLTKLVAQLHTCLHLRRLESESRSPSAPILFCVIHRHQALQIRVAELEELLASRPHIINAVVRCSAAQHILNPSHCDIHYSVLCGVPRCHLLRKQSDAEAQLRAELEQEFSEQTQALEERHQQQVRSTGNAQFRRGWSPMLSWGKSVSPKN